MKVTWICIPILSMLSAVGARSEGIAPNVGGGNILEIPNDFVFPGRIPVIPGRIPGTTPPRIGTVDPVDFIDPCTPFGPDPFAEGVGSECIPEPILRGPCGDGDCDPPNPKKERFFYFPKSSSQ